MCDFFLKKKSYFQNVNFAKIEHFQNVIDFWMRNLEFGSVWLLEEIMTRLGFSYQGYRIKRRPLLGFYMPIKGWYYSETMRWSQKMRALISPQILEEKFWRKLLFRYLKASSSW